MKTRLVQWILSQNYTPTFLGVWVNPFYIARNGLHHAIRSFGSYIVGKTLDIGCGQKPYQHLVSATEYIGLEIDTPENRQHKKADVFYPGGPLPFDNAVMDSVVSHQVFEHIFTPSQFLQEIHRVLKPQGCVMLSVPFVWDEHEQPFDFARYSSFALKALLEEQGFELIAAKKTVANMGLIFQLINAYLYKILFTKNGYWNQYVCFCLMAPITLMGIVAGKIFPQNPDLYLDNVVVARKA
jgi:SAM-dependent methyltransferase